MLFAQGDYIEYRGDPLMDFALMRFLDRFVCKNPKQKISDHGGSLMQRTSVLVKGHVRENPGMYAGMPKHCCHLLNSAYSFIRRV